jgi:hypothetical protein
MTGGRDCSVRVWDMEGKFISWNISKWAINILFLPFRSIFGNPGTAKALARRRSDVLRSTASPGRRSGHEASPSPWNLSKGR